MALRKGKLITSKGLGYFLADDLGMAYDLQMIHLQDFGGDVQKMNERIILMDAEIKKLPHYAAGWMPTLGIHRVAWDAITDEWKKILQPRVHILLYDDTVNLKATDPTTAIPSLRVFGQADLVWKSDKEVWTYWDQNSFGYRYQTVPIPVADPATPPVVIPPVVNPPLVVVPPVSEIHDQEMRLQCIQVAANSSSGQILNADQIVINAKKFANFVLDKTVQG